MKIYILGAVLALGLVTGCKTDVEKTQAETAPRMGTKIADLPPAVQNTIRNYAPGAKIDDIDKERRSGRTIYEITFADPGRNPKLHVAEDGTIVRTISEKAGAQTPGQKFQALPPAVQNSIRRYAPPHAEIADIDEETRSGRTVYEVQFKAPGKNPKMHIASDGTLLSD